MLKDNEFSERVFDCLLRELESAPSFDNANETVKELTEYENLKEEQINQIIRIAIRNNQFRLSRKGSKFLDSLTKKQASIIDPFLLKAYNKVKDQF